MLLTEHSYFSTLLPRIPVSVKNDIAVKVRARRRVP
jgi:hypothetical protein